MIRKLGTLFGIVMLTFLCMGARCGKKQTTTLPEKEPAPVEMPDTLSREDTGIMMPDTSDEVSFRERDLEAELQRQVREALQPVYFEYNSYELTSETVDRLGIVSSFLSDHSTLRVLIEGHCDERGSSEYNMALGENRARAVKQYLMNYGVPSLQLEITSWGEERLVNPFCADEVCHQKNRRVEFKVLE